MKFELLTAKDWNYLPLPAEMTFQVQRHHILKGEQGCPSNCPIARAAAEYLQVPLSLVFAGSVGLTIAWDIGGMQTGYLSQNCNHVGFVNEFDRYDSLEKAREIGTIRVTYTLDCYYNRCELPV